MFICLLRNLTKSVNPQRDKISEDYHNRYKLQTYSRKVLPDFRVKSCCRSRLSGADVVTVKQSANGYSYGNLQMCGSVWVCPVCASRIVHGRREELSHFIENVYKAGHFVSMLTLTVPHGFGDDCSKVLNGLLSSYKLMLNRTSWFKRPSARKNYYSGFACRIGLQGSIRTLEVTHGGNGWHPHLHVLLVTDREVTEVEADKVLGLWQSACITQGVPCPNEHGVKITRCTKSTIADYVQKWGIDYEMTSGNTTKDGKEKNLTPFQILSRSKDSSVYSLLFRQYADAFKGKRQLVYSEGLRAKYNLTVEKTDEELLNDEESKAVVIASIDLAGWKSLLRDDARGDFLDTLRCNGGDVVDAADLWGISQFINLIS